MVLDVTKYYRCEQIIDRSLYTRSYSREGVRSSKPSQLELTWVISLGSGVDEGNLFAFSSWHWIPIYRPDEVADPHNNGLYDELIN